MQKLRVLLLLALAANLAGCVTLRDSRNAPWDPKPGHSLLDQIPNWDDNAKRRCGGHLRESVRGDRSTGC
jgi:hypothetical protein